MKTKGLILVTALIAVAVLLCSCSLFNWGTIEKPGGDPLPENGIYNSDSELFIIRNAGFDEELFLELLGELEAVRSRIVDLAAVDSEKHDHEIVLGDTDRPISKTARQKLDRLDRNKDSDVGILIYSDGSSVAVVYDDDPDGITARLAIDYFIENCVKTQLVLAEGVVYKTTFDLVDGYGATVDSEYEDKMWAALSEAVGGDDGQKIVNAMKQFYSIYSEDMILWLANLYEPGICICNGLYGEDDCKKTKYCGTSGFYYSNSARDTAGYLPDVETTFQALGLLDSTGVTRVVGGWENMLDQHMLEGIGAFVRSLQIEDGNFIHPQWADMEVGISRKSRDLNWASQLLEKLGLRPYYTTPTGIPGIGAPKASSLMAAPLGTSSVKAVSSVVLTASYLPELEDDVSFKAFLESLNIRYNSYSGGNRLSSMLVQITARDSQLRNEGKDYRLLDILVEFLNENRNTENGTWDHTPKTDPNYSVYEGVNGLMKISGVYNTAKIPMPYAREACATAYAAITSDEKIGEIVDLYNPWHALTVVLNTLINFGGEEGKALASEIRGELYKTAPEAIAATRENTLIFAKDGGSFSYNRDFSAPNSQGCPAAVIYSKEGDVNGTVMGSSSLIGHVYSALGLIDYKVPLFGETERILFMEELRSMNPGKKPPEDLSYDVEDFESDVVGEEPIGRDISYKTVSEGASVTVVERDDGEGKALEIDSRYYKDNSESVSVDCRSNSNLAKTFVFEGDFCVLSTNRYYTLQVKMSAAYMFALKWENDRITLWECSSSSNAKSVNTKFDPTVELGEWFRVKVEYYYGDADSVRIKFYFDNLEDEEEMKLIAVTDNYYDEKGVKLNGKGTPSSTYDNTLIYVLSDATVRMQLDNLASYKSNEEYVPYTDNDAPLSFNVDAPERDEELYDYEDGEIPIGFVVSGEASVDGEDDNKKLNIGDAAGESRVTLPLNLRISSANATVIDTKILVRSLDAGKGALRLVGTENTGNVFGFAIKVASDGSYAELYEDTDNRNAQLPEVKIPTDTFVQLKIVYYHAEDVSLIYVDGKFSGATGAIYTGGASRTPARIIAVVPQGASVSLDDTVAEKNVLEYAEATKPKNDSIVYDFEGELDGVVTSGVCAVAKDGENKLLRLNSVNSGAGVTIPINRRSEISSLLLLNMDLIISNVKNSGETHRIIFKDSLGLSVYELAIKKDGNTVGIYEVGLAGVKNSPLITLELSKHINVEIRYFAEEKTTIIYKDGVASAMTNLISSAENYRSNPKTMEIVSTDSGAVLGIDNLRVETLYEAFALADVDSTSKESGKITFDNSSVGSLPEHLYYVLNSDGSSLRVEEHKDKNGNYSNVGVFTTGQENNDSIGVKAEEDLSAYSAITFEVDFKVDSNQTGSIYQLFFTKDKQVASDIAYLIFIDRGSDGKLTLTDYSQSSKSNSKSNVLASGIDSKVWNSLKVEIFRGDKDTVRMRISLNGEVVFVSDNYFGYNTTLPDTHPEPNGEINKVYLYSFLDTKGTVYVDNMALYGNNSVCDDPVGPS